MITATIEDIYGTTIKIAESRSGYFRLDFEGNDFIAKKHTAIPDMDVPVCISLDINEARVLQCALNSYFKGDE